MSVGNQHRVSATFEATDDLLWQAVAGRLPQLPPVILGRSGLIGPLVELAIARMAAPDAYRRVTVEPPIFHQIEHALANGAISGAGVRDRAGVFPLSLFDPSAGAGNTLWDQWAKHAENAAVSAGLAKSLAAGLMGALGELQDNVFEHSGRPVTGLVAYGAGDGAFEFVVADAGRGVLASLRENPEFAHLADFGHRAARCRVRRRVALRPQHGTWLRHRSAVSCTRPSHRRATISKWRPRPAAVGRCPEPHRPGRARAEGVA